VKVCAHQCVKWGQSYLNLYKLGASVTLGADVGQARVQGGPSGGGRGQMGLESGGEGRDGWWASWAR
jgi:hypothetical protein